MKDNSSSSAEGADDLCLVASRHVSAAPDLKTFEVVARSRALLKRYKDHLVSIGILYDRCFDCDAERDTAKDAVVEDLVRRIERSSPGIKIAAVIPRRFVWGHALTVLADIPNNHAPLAA